MPQQIPDSALKKIRRVGKMLNALAAVSPVLAGRVAFRIFCSPRRLPLREEDRDFLETAQHFDFQAEKKLRIRGYTWQSEQNGAPEVLCLHGWESSSARWKRYVKGLRESGFTVHAFDAPASGRSDGAMLNVLLYSRVVKKFIAEKGRPYAVVAHSLGAAAAVMSAAILNAPRPERMILLGVFAESSRVIRDFGEILGVNEAVIQNIHREVERRSGMPIEEYSVAKKSSLLADVQGFVLHDRDDEVAPVAEGRMVAESWNARYLETEGLGHRMQDKKVVAEVVKFLTAPSTK
jgi:pimeloyl-ACP methyl ester carboxylesterase